MRKHNPAYPDNTVAQRQAKRRALLAEAAKRDGWPGLSAALTAWKNGLAVLKKLQKG